MKRIGVGSVMLGALSMVGCFAPAPPAHAPSTYTVLQRKALYNGYGVALSVIGAIERSDIERLVAKERRIVVRVAIYTPDQTVATEKPFAMWEHTDAKGLKQLY